MSIKNSKAYRLGNSGESKVVLLLNTFNPEQFNIHNIMLKDGDTTHQIDVICITSAGIFVMEVKNICGYKINCDNDWTYWEYDWVKNKKLVKCTLYNPIWQNKTHVEQIRKILPDYPIHSMVVFSNNNTLVHENDLDEMVVNLKTMKSYIQKFPWSMTSGQMLYAKKMIEKNNHKEISLDEHVKNIKTNLGRK